MYNSYIEYHLDGARSSNSHWNHKPCQSRICLKHCQTKPFQRKANDIVKEQVSIIYNPYSFWPFQSTLSKPLPGNYGKTTFWSLFAFQLWVGAHVNPSLNVCNKQEAVIACSWAVGRLLKSAKRTFTSTTPTNFVFSLFFSACFFLAFK